MEKEKVNLDGWLNASNNTSDSTIYTKTVITCDNTIYINN